YLLNRAKSVLTPALLQCLHGGKAYSFVRPLMDGGKGRPPILKKWSEIPHPLRSDPLSQSAFESGPTGEAATGAKRTGG
ncbi:unnamed protein product, partial [Allacma fusca]